MVAGPTGVGDTASQTAGWGALLNPPPLAVSGTSTTAGTPGNPYLRSQPATLHYVLWWVTTNNDQTVNVYADRGTTDPPATYPAPSANKDVDSSTVDACAAATA